MQKVTLRLIIIFDCVFEDNSANPNDNKLFASDEIVFGGGALWCCDGLTTITNTNFTNNNATYGGAIRGAVNAKDCTFDQNTAFDGNGGGIDMTIDAVVSIQDCIFTDNEAKGEYAPRGDAKGGKSQGGAIHSYKIEGMVIDNITCTGNTAFRGGAIDLYEMNFTTISNSKFEENEATLGGGIAVVGDNCNFTNLSMSYNVGNDGEYDDGREFLDGQGGGIWVNGSNTRFENSTLDNNMATFGGGIMSLGDDGALLSSTTPFRIIMLSLVVEVYSFKGMMLISLTMIFHITKLLLVELSGYMETIYMWKTSLPLKIPLKTVVHLLFTPVTV